MKIDVQHPVAGVSMAVWQAMNGGKNGILLLDFGLRVADRELPSRPVCATQAGFDLRN